MSSKETDVGHVQPERDVGEPLNLTYKEAAKKLGVSLSKLYLLMRDGEIRKLELGPKVMRIPMSEIDAYQDRLKAAQWAPSGPVGGQGEGHAA